MDNDKENILKLFKNGATIKGLTDMLYSQLKQRESNKPKGEKNKINLKDCKNTVEQIIYEDHMKQRGSL